MSTSSKSLGTKFIRGTFWTVGMRWLSRFMGIASMAVIARLLTPEDFGVVAVTSTLVGLMESFTDLGVDIALIRHPAPQRKHYDTAWTFNIIVHAFSAVMIALTGFFASNFYSDPHYETVLYVMSAVMVINAFGNVGCIDFRRNLTYHKDFQFNLIIQLLGVLSTLVFAFLLRSYWALVLGMLVRSIAKIPLSYMMHPYRPRLSLAASQEMFNFSLWIMIRSVAMFLTNKADRLILAAYFNSTILGLYAIASDLATMAVFELLNPIGRALFPVLATKKNDPVWLEENIKKIFNITATVAMATGVGLAAIAEPVLTLIYGSKYIEAAPILVLLALLNVLIGFNQPIGQILLLINRAKDFAFLCILEGVTTMVVIFVLSAKQFDFQVIIYGRLAVTTITFFRLFYLLKITKIIGFRSILVAWQRPVIAGIYMFIVIDYLLNEFVYISSVYLVPLLILMGALTYSFFLLFIWWVMRKPSGIEREVLQRVLK